VLIEKGDGAVAVERTMIDVPLAVPEQSLELAKTRHEFDAFN
jgi:hypothetical protein